MEVPAWADEVMTEVTAIPGIQKLSFSKNGYHRVFLDQPRHSSWRAEFLLRNVIQVVAEASGGYYVLQVTRTS